MCVCVCVCVCTRTRVHMWVCVWERERQTDRQTLRQTDRQRQREERLKWVHVVFYQPIKKAFFSTFWVLHMIINLIFKVAARAVTRIWVYCKQQEQSAAGHTVSDILIPFYTQNFTQWYWQWQSKFWFHSTHRTLLSNTDSQNFDSVLHSHRTLLSDTDSQNLDSILHTELYSVILTHWQSTFWFHSTHRTLLSDTDTLTVHILT